MTKEITRDDLNEIWFRWDSFEKPLGIEDKAWKFTEKLNEKISDMVFLLGDFDKKAASALGEQVGAVVTQPFLLCYYIGYELASGKMNRADSSLYLTAATEPIDTFVLKLLEILVGKGITSPEKGRDMAVEIAKLTGEASNNICVLGIENFGKVATNSSTSSHTSDSGLKKCPYCAEMIQEAAIVCRHCGRTLTETRTEYPPKKKDNYGLAITSLALGIFSLLAWLYPICGFPISVIGLILGITSTSSSKRSLAIAGIVMSAIGLILTVANAAIGAYLGYTGQLYQ